MKLEDLEYILNHEWEEKKLSYCIDKYCVTEKIEYNHNEIYGSISCGIPEEKCFFGEVEFRIGVDALTKENKAWFGYLAVNTKVEKQGIGSCLMKILIDNIRLAKQYWNVENKIRLSGWLSDSDHKNGNWFNSVPFYINQAGKNKCEFELKINDDEKTYYTKEDFFANVGEKDGHIIYWI